VRLLAQAKFLPIDAQHIGQTKFPTGTVKDGVIERRGDDLVGPFQPKRSEVQQLGQRARSG